MKGLIDEFLFEEDEVEAWAPKLALITNPASRHIAAALQIARFGAHLFIEKPLSNRLEGVDELINHCTQQSLVLMVGYNFRFHPPLIRLKGALDAGEIGRLLTIRAEVGRYLPDWRSGVPYVDGASARKDLGGGVILELSHELDYVRWLAGEVHKVVAIVERTSELEIDVEDVAEIALLFETGATGMVHLDMLDRAGSRGCRLVGTEGTLVWEATDESVKVFRPGEGWSIIFSDSSFDRNTMYLDELRHFIESVDRSESSKIDGREGKRVLEIALAAKESATTERTVDL